jgi:hypothetical protein
MLPTDPAQPHLIQDADGDGIPDSYAFKVPRGMLPSDLQRHLADRLRDPLVLTATGADPDAIWITVRVVPHGAMVNLNAHAPCCGGGCTYSDPLVASVLGEDPGAWLPVALQTPYLPEVEEWALRSRGGCVVPRSRASTNMATDLATQLFDPHRSKGPAGTLSATELMDPSMRVWWPYNLDGIEKRSTSKWRENMYAGSGKGTYELNHLVTTVSSDDLLIRSAFGPDPVTGPGSGESKDWITRITDAGTSKWAQYPATVSDRRLKGRIKFSFPYFSKTVAYGGFWQPDPNVPGYLNNPANSQWAELAEDAQTAFGLMLRHYVGFLDFDGDGTLSVPHSGATASADDVALSISAASLAANVINAADGNDIPAPVEVRDWRTGGTTGIVAYGLERQPFVTELYGKLAWLSSTPGDTPPLDITSSFAVELYNPFDQAIALDSYFLRDASTAQFTDTLETNSVHRLGSAQAPAPTFPVGTAIPARSFYTVYCGSFAQPAPLTGDSVDYASAGGILWAVDEKSRIQLVQKINGADVVVDEFDVGVDSWRSVGGPQSTSWAPTPLQPTLGGGAGHIELDWERDSRIDDSGNSYWRFPVPRAAERHNRTPGHTLGKQSEYDSAQDLDANGAADPIRSVQMDFPNTGDLRSTFPTTGSLLLLMRHAHTVNGSVQIPFNRQQSRAMAKDYYKIDNGRMPVFDEPVRPHELSVPRYRFFPTSGAGAQQGIEALPWGQLVFDYFTALPLNYEDVCFPGTVQGYPAVQEQGLRVTGRININAAPYSVLAGLPLRQMTDFDPGNTMPSLKQKIYDTLFNQTPSPLRYDGVTPTNGSRVDNLPIDIGQEVAQAIVGYRGADRIPSGEPSLQGGNETYRTMRSPEVAGPKRFRQGTGFLTVGELLNVRQPVDNSGMVPPWTFWMDAGELSKGVGGDYVRAVARMVALGDWVTTKSNVFTIYGTIRGSFVAATDPKVTNASLNAVNQRAIRFQTTIDRTPVLLGGDPQYIGARITGNYADVRNE